MRHRFHAICPYFAMFPETFAQKHLCLAEPNSVVLDPFCGRGTTVFEALLSGRTGIGIDVNPVAVCVSGAKANAPQYSDIIKRIDELEASLWEVEDEVQDDPFFRMCFSAKTLGQILYLRRSLNWRHDAVDCFIAAMATGCLHGESHRSERVMSNRMPRTISTKPAYSVRWWEKHGYEAPQRDAFEILRAEAEFRYASLPPKLKGIVVEGDARNGSLLLPEWQERVGLVITSPPYLDVTHFREDQWLRVWFLGGDSKPKRAEKSDDRHVSALQYWKFLAESWQGIAPLLTSTARIVVRIGGKRLTLESARLGLEDSLAGTFGHVSCVDANVSEIKNGQLRTFRPDAAGTRREFDLVFQVEK